MPHSTLARRSVGLSSRTASRIHRFMVGRRRVVERVARRRVHHDPLWPPAIQSDGGILQTKGSGRVTDINSTDEFNW